MEHGRIVVKLVMSVIAGLLLSSLLSAQPEDLQRSGAVPRLVNFSGKALDEQGKPITGNQIISIAIYRDESGGDALWRETQNATVDAEGGYSVQLGAASVDGLPIDLFSSAEARWLGVSVNGASEQPRVLLLSVPYALKAADAQTLGGYPASAFLRAVMSRMMPVKEGRLSPFISLTANSIGNLVPSRRRPSSSRPMPITRASPVRK